MTQVEREMVVVIHAGYPNDIMLTECIASYFVPRGRDVAVISISEPGFKANLEGLLRQPERIIGFISISLYAFEFKLTGGYLHEVTDIPVLLYLLDHPARFRTIFPPHFERIVIATTDPEWADFWTTYINPQARCCVTNIGFGRSPRLEGMESDFEAFMARAQWAVMPVNFTQYGRDLPELMTAIDNLPAATGAPVRRMIERAMAEFAIPVHEIVASEWYVEQDDDVFESLCLLIPIVDAFRKLARRHFVLESLIDMPVLFTGLCYPEDMVRRHPEKFTDTKMKETFELLKQSRVVVNTNSGMNALHDRIVNAIHVGAVSLTDRNPFIDRLFGEDGGLALYDYDRMPPKERLAALIEEPEVAFEMALTARARMDQDGLFEHNFRVMEALMTEVPAAEMVEA